MGREDARFCEFSPLAECGILSVFMIGRSLEESQYIGNQTCNDSDTVDGRKIAEDPVESRKESSVRPGQDQGSDQDQNFQKDKTFFCHGKVCPAQFHVHGNSDHRIDQETGQEDLPRGHGPDQGKCINFPVKK